MWKFCWHVDCSSRFGASGGSLPFLPPIRKKPLGGSCRRPTQRGRGWTCLPSAASAPCRQLARQELYTYHHQHNLDLSSILLLGHLSLVQYLDTILHLSSLIIGNSLRNFILIRDYNLSMLGRELNTVMSPREPGRPLLTLTVCGLSTGATAWNTHFFNP